jgi:hypothetical protein
LNLLEVPFGSGIFRNGIDPSRPFGSAWPLDVLDSSRPFGNGIDPSRPFGLLQTFWK